MGNARLAHRPPPRAGAGAGDRPSPSRAGNAVRAQSVGHSEGANLTGIEASIVDQIVAALKALIPDVELPDIPGFDLPDLDLPDVDLSEYLPDFPDLKDVWGPLSAWGDDQDESADDQDESADGQDGGAGQAVPDHEDDWDLPSASEVADAIEAAVARGIEEAPEPESGDDDWGFAAVVGNVFDQAAFVSYGGLGYIDVGSRTAMNMPDITWDVQGESGDFTVKPRSYATPADLVYPSNAAPPGVYTRTAKLEEQDLGMLGSVITISYLVDGDTSAAVRKAEEEHAADTVDAYNMSVLAWGNAVNAATGTPFKGRSEQEAKDNALKQLAVNAGIPWGKWGYGPAAWSRAYQDLTKQTIAKRDDSGSHTWKPQVEYVIIQDLEAVCSLTSPTLLGPGQIRW